MPLLPGRKSSMPNLLPMLALLLFTAPAQAQIYKCVGEDGVIYSDSPCADSGSQTVPDISGAGRLSNAAPLPQKPPVILQLDTAVKSAIALNDLNRAEALATTREHWEWIAEARKNAPQNDRIVSTDPAASPECLQAKSALDQEAGKPFPDPEVLEAKRSLMYASCGLPEPPIEVVTGAPAVGIFPYYGNPYGYPRHPHRFPHGHKPHWPQKPSGYTSPPYDRHKETPFGSRFIRPENGLR